MKLKLKSTFHLYLFIGVIALGLTLLISPLLPRWFEKYTVQIEEDTRSIPNPNILYHDFDHDGFSEMAALKYQQNIDESALKVYAYNGGLINQWTFEERWLPHSMIFGDYNHDGYDEIYVFTKNRDSLFLYAVDSHNPNGFLLFRNFIVRAPQGIKRWDLRPIAGVFLDSDQDGYDDLIVNVMAGYAQQPRRLYCFSVHKKQLLYQSLYGSAFLAVPRVVKANHRPLILIEGSVSLGNTKTNSPFSDNAAWLTVFDSRLNFVFPPIAFKEKNTEVNALPCGTDNRLIVVLVKYGSKEKPFVHLLLYDWKGNLIKQKEFHGRNWFLVQASTYGRNQTFLVNAQKSCAYPLARDLELGPCLSFQHPIDNILETRFDLDADFETEWLGRRKNTLLIFSDDFSSTLTVNLPGFQWSFYNISLKKNGSQPPQLFIQGGEKKYLLRYRFNPLYPFYHLSRMVLFLIFYLLVWGGVTLFNILSGYKTVVQTLVSNPGRGIMLLNASGTIRYMNHIMVDQFQLGLTSYMGKRALSVFVNFPAMARLLTQLLTEKTTLKQELQINRKDVSLKGELFGKPITTLFGYTYGFYVEINDYSKPVQDDRLKVWSKTVQKMAHDIKAPLSSIGLNLSTLKMKLADVAPEVHNKIEPELDLMLREVYRVKEKTINFLKFTNLERPNLTRIDLLNVLNSTLELFKSYAEQSVDFYLEVPSKPVYLIADAEQLQMAFQAIIENAIDAIKGKGSIAVSVILAERIDEQFRLYVEIDIADTGKGIPNNIQDKIFEPYFTTKKEGTGMGLAIARKIVLDHNGEIRIFSTENFATVVKIMLPLGNHVDDNQQSQASKTEKIND